MALRAALGIALAACSIGTSFAARPVPPGVDRAEVEHAARKLRCDCGCHPQSVFDCVCGHADNMWNAIAAEVAGGAPGPGGATAGPMTGAEVVAARIAKFGEGVLLAPRARGFNLVAWLGPAAALIVGAAVVFGIARRLSRGSSAPGDDEVALPPVAPEYADRIRRAVEENR